MDKKVIKTFADEVKEEAKNIVDWIFNSAANDLVYIKERTKVSFMITKDTIDKATVTIQVAELNPLRILFKEQIPPLWVGTEDFFVHFVKEKIQNKVDHYNELLLGF